MSVVPFDDLPEGAHFSPALTTIRQDFTEIGRRAVGTLIAEIDGRDTGWISLVEPHVIVRESTAAPRSGR